MLAYDTTTLTVLVLVFFAIAAIGGFVVTSRRDRLARHESVGSSNDDLALTH